MRRLGFALGVVVFMLALPQATQANSLTPTIIDLLSPNPGTTDFSGLFTADNDVALILFSLTSESLVQARTTSGAAGGFDAYLSLFDTTGALYLENDDAASGGPDAELVDRLTGSTSFLLGPGAYTLAISQYFNLPSFTLGDPFANDDSPFYTQAFAPDPASCDRFIDLGGQCRTGVFAGELAITPVNPQPVPEPGTLGLLATGLTGLVVGRLRRRG